MKRAWAVLLATLVVVLPARLYAAFRLVDDKTGFYSDGNRLAAAAAAVALLGIVLVMAFGRRKEPKYQRPPLRSVSAAVFAALSGIFIAGESLVGLIGGDGFVAMNILLALLGVCAAAAMLTAAYGFASGEAVLRRHPLVALFAPLWGCLCMISLFISYGAPVNRFDNVYHTFTVALLLLFLFSQAKLLSGVDEDGGAKMVFSYGFAAAVAALTDSVPNLALLFAGRKTLGTFPVGLYLSNLFLAVYILVFLAAEGRRRTPLPMVAITPEFAGGDEPANAEKPKDGGAAEAASDPFPLYLEFLQKNYRGENKFVENAKHEMSSSASVKS